MSDFITAEEEQSCTVCNKLTDQIEVNFETPLHPGTCADSLWEQYVEALNNFHECPADLGEYCIDCNRHPEEKVDHEAQDESNSDWRMLRSEPVSVVAVGEAGEPSDAGDGEEARSNL